MLYPACSHVSLHACRFPSPKLHALGLVTKTCQSSLQALAAGPSRHLRLSMVARKAPGACMIRLLPCSRELA